MTLRKKSPLHDKWHRRVEGQIRDCIFHHPEWFNFEHGYDRTHCINSIAKRIVGEIVSDARMGAITDTVAAHCSIPDGTDSVFMLELDTGVMVDGCDTSKPSIDTPSESC